MSPIDWALEPLRNYTDFSGRASRSEYWWYLLFVFIVAIIAGIIDAIMGMRLVSLLLNLALLIPSLAVGVRRMHDTNRSGWWYVIPTIAMMVAAAMVLVGTMAGSGIGVVIGSGLFMIGIALGIAAFIFCILPGTFGHNRYGSSTT